MAIGPVPRPAARSDARLERLRREQAGVVTRAQLRVLGITRHRVRDAVRAHRWQLLGPRLVVLHGGPLLKRQRWWAAVLHAGPQAALAGLTALEADGLHNHEVEAVHVVVPRGVRVPPLASPLMRLVVHESRRLSEDDVHPVKTPRRTRTARSVVDAASWASSPGRCRSICASSVQQGLVKAADVRQVVLSTARITHRTLLLETLGDVEGGSHSLPELDWVKLLRAARLPLPDRQVKVRRPDGTYYLDGYWKEYDLGSEINGAQHDEVLIREYDHDRMNELVVQGRLMLQLSSFAIRHRSLYVADVVERALRSRGWKPDDERRQQSVEGGAITPASTDTAEEA